VHAVSGWVSLQNNPSHLLHVGRHVKSIIMGHAIVWYPSVCAGPREPISAEQQC